MVQPNIQHKHELKLKYIKTHIDQPLNVISHCKNDSCK